MDNMYDKAMVDMKKYWEECAARNRRMRIIDNAKEPITLRSIVDSEDSLMGLHERNAYVSMPSEAFSQNIRSEIFKYKKDIDRGFNRWLRDRTIRMSRGNSKSNKTLLQESILQTIDPKRYLARMHKLYLSSLNDVY